MGEKYCDRTTREGGSWAGTIKYMPSPGAGGDSASSVQEPALGDHKASGSTLQASDQGVVME